jgi:sulfatase modifying factor 1
MAGGWTGDGAVQEQEDEVRQRMRWIPPGLFLMGSPADEPERFDDEQQHEVELTRGFWFGETCCTQALWQTVLEQPDHV